MLLICYEFTHQDRKVSTLPYSGPWLTILSRSSVYDEMRSCKRASQKVIAFGVVA